MVGSFKPLIMIQTRNGFSPPDRPFFEAQALSRSATTYEVLILLLSEASGPGALRRVHGTGMKSLRNAEDEEELLRSLILACPAWVWTWNKKKLCRLTSQLDSTSDSSLRSPGVEPAVWPGYLYPFWIRSPVSRSICSENIGVNIGVTNYLCWHFLHCTHSFGVSQSIFLAFVAEQYCYIQYTSQTFNISQHSIILVFHIIFQYFISLPKESFWVVIQVWEFETQVLNVPVGSYIYIYIYICIGI